MISHAGVRRDLRFRKPYGKLKLPLQSGVLEYITRVLELLPTAAAECPHGTVSFGRVHRNGVFSSTVPYYTSAETARA